MHRRRDFFKFSMILNMSGIWCMTCDADRDRDPYDQNVVELPEEQSMKTSQTTSTGQKTETRHRIPNGTFTQLSLFFKRFTHGVKLGYRTFFPFPPLAPDSR